MWDFASFSQASFGIDTEVDPNGSHGDPGFLLHHSPRVGWNSTSEFVGFWHVGKSHIPHRPSLELDGQGLIYLFEPSTYQLKLLGWYMVSERFRSRRSYIAYVVLVYLTWTSTYQLKLLDWYMVSYMKSIGPAREGECWEVPQPTLPKSWVGQGFIYPFGHSTYQLKLLGLVHGILHDRANTNRTLIRSCN